MKSKENMSYKQLLKHLEDQMKLQDSWRFSNLLHPYVHGETIITACHLTG